MAEPENQLDKLLKASAEGRRAKYGADLKMPNVMRSQLQAEVARKLAQTSEHRQRGRFADWWPRMAIGSAMAIVLIGVSLIVMKRSQVTDNQQLALQSKKLSEKLAESKPFTSTAQSEVRKSLSSPSDAFTLNKDLAQLSKNETGRASEHTGDFGLHPEAKKNGAQLDGKAGAVHGGQMPEAADATAKTDVLPFTSAAPNANPEGGAKAMAAIKAPEAQVASASTNKLASSRHVKEVPQRFVATDQKTKQSLVRQTFQSANKTKSSSGLLSNFQVEQSGNDIRLLDSDGSTYSGRLISIPTPQQPATLAAKETNAKSKLRALGDEAAAPAPEPAANEFRFHATGSSRSLKLPVTIDGTYVISAQQSQQAASDKPMENPSGERIIGRAKIGSENEVSIDATAIKDQ